MAKGKSGSFRANSLTASDLTAMQNHELRLDHAGARRSVRRDDAGDPIPPLIFNPLRQNCLTQAYAAHVEGARQNKGAGKICRHAFVQFPTDLPVTPETEQMMLDQAVAFVNRTHGGNAVFWARLDRDEDGRHGVDVFYAPRYEKKTKRKTQTWISLTKFGKARAVERFGQRVAEKKNPATGRFEKVMDATGNPVMVDCDSQWFQGRAFQDLWFEHLRDVVGLDWVERGKPKVGRNPDRLEVEEYKLDQERQKLDELKAKAGRNRERFIQHLNAQIAEKKAALNELAAAESAAQERLQGLEGEAAQIIREAHQEAAQIAQQAEPPELIRLRTENARLKELNAGWQRFRDLTRQVLMEILPAPLFTAFRDRFNRLWSVDPLNPERTPQQDAHTHSPR